MGREFLPRRRRLGGRPSVVEPAGIATDPLELLLDFLDQGRAERRSSGGRFCRRGGPGPLRPPGGLRGGLLPFCPLPGGPPAPRPPAPRPAPGAPFPP